MITDTEAIIKLTKLRKMADEADYNKEWLIRHIDGYTVTDLAAIDNWMHAFKWKIASLITDEDKITAMKDANELYEYLTNLTSYT